MTNIILTNISCLKVHNKKYNNRQKIYTIYLLEHCSPIQMLYFYESAVCFSKFYKSLLSQKTCCLYNTYWKTNRLFKTLLQT